MWDFCHPDTQWEANHLKLPAQDNDSCNYAPVIWRLWKQCGVKRASATAALLQAPRWGMLEGQCWCTAPEPAWHRVLSGGLGFKLDFFPFFCFKSSNYLWLTKNEHEAVPLVKTNEIICSGLLWRSWRRMALNKLPPNFLRSQTVIRQAKHLHLTVWKQTSYMNHLLLLRLDRDPVNK